MSPIYEPDLSHEDMRKAQNSFICAECDNILTVAWSAEKNCYMLRCGRSLGHSTIKPIGKDLWLQEIKERLRGAPSMKTTTELTKFTEEQMLQRLDLVKFPKDLTTVELALIARISIEYGLDPLFNELMIYQGRPYVIIDARRRKAQETGNLDGINGRPATKEEKEARRVPDEDYLFVCQVWVKGATHPFEGWGRVKAAETKGSEYLPIVKDPAAQCEKRAEAQALRRAFHLPLPSFEEIVEGEFKEVPPPAKEAPKKNRPAPADKQVSTHVESKPEELVTEQGSPGIDMDWMTESCSKLKWKESTLKSYLKSKYQLDTTGSLQEVIARLKHEQQAELVKEITDRLEMV